MHLWMDECMYVNSIPMYVCFMIIILINVNSIPGEREPRNIIWTLRSRSSDLFQVFHRLCRNYRLK